VDNARPSACSDATNSSGGGSQARPWCTINRAVAQAEPGDVVYVKNGIYNEQVYIEGKHGGESYITIQSFPGHSPIIEGDGVDGGRNKILASTFIKLVGFTIRNLQHGVFVEGSSNIVLANITVYNVGQEGIHIKSNSSFVTLRDSIIHDTGKWKYNGEGVYIGTSSSQQPKTPPYDNTHDVLLKGNKIFNTVDECIEAKEGTYNVTIDGNTLYNCLLASKNTDPGWGAIELMDAGKYYRSNPSHVVKNSIIKSAKTGIGVHTGATVFNNVIYGQTGGYRGIYVDNEDADHYVRRIYHNTIDLPPARAVVVSDRVSVDVRNNIGPGSAGNIAARDGFFLSKAAGDYRLAPGGAPIDAGADATALVPHDIEGRSRSGDAAPDMGAYEFGAGAAGAPVR
jgi:hypothetical protein